MFNLTKLTLLCKLRLAMILQTWSRYVLVKKCPLVEKCRSGNVLRSRSVSVKKWGSRNVGRKMSGRDLSLHENGRNVSGISTGAELWCQRRYPYTAAHIWISSHFSNLVSKSPNSNVIHFGVNVCQHSSKKYDVKSQIPNPFRSCSSKNLPSVIVP